MSSFLILVLCFSAHAQLPTNNVAPSRVAVVTDTNGNLTAPGNFFSANSNLLNASVNAVAGSQTPITTDVNIAGHKLTNGATISATNISATNILGNPMATNGLIVGDQNFISFDATGAVRGNRLHTGGGTGGIEPEVEFSSQGSFSFTGGQDSQRAGSSHFGASLQSWEWWHMQYEFVPSAATNWDSVTGLWGYSKPLGWAVKAGDGTMIQQLSPAFRAEVNTNNAVAVLRYYSHFGKPTGWNQVQLTGTPDSPGFLSSNNITWRNFVASNSVNAPAIIASSDVATPMLNATNAQFGNGDYTTTPVTPLLTFGSAADTNLFWHQDAANTLDWYFNNGSGFKRVLEIGARNGGTFTLRDANGAISVDVWNHGLQNGNWAATGNFAAQSFTMNSGATNGNYVKTDGGGNLYTTNAVPAADLSGSIADARHSTNVALYNGNGNFSALSGNAPGVTNLPANCASYGPQTAASAATNYTINFSGTNRVTITLTNNFCASLFTNPPGAVAYYLSDLGATNHNLLLPWNAATFGGISYVYNSNWISSVSGSNAVLTLTNGHQAILYFEMPTNSTAWTNMTCILSLQ